MHVKPHKHKDVIRKNGLDGTSFAPLGEALTCRYGVLLRNGELLPSTSNYHDFICWSSTRKLLIRYGRFIDYTLRSRNAWVTLSCFLYTAWHVDLAFLVMLYHTLRCIARSQMAARDSPIALGELISGTLSLDLRSSPNIILACQFRPHREAVLR